VSQKVLTTKDILSRRDVVLPNNLCVLCGMGEKFINNLCIVCVIIGWGDVDS